MALSVQHPFTNSTAVHKANGGRLLCYVLPASHGNHALTHTNRICCEHSQEDMLQELSICYTTLIIHVASTPTQRWEKKYVTNTVNRLYNAALQLSQTCQRQPISLASPTVRAGRDGTTSIVSTSDYSGQWFQTFRDELWSSAWERWNSAGGA